mmetsp:Transcript_23762/g.30784  ORF Transcript_23762/g.30784 Transcript_23762/m.30784 type:complete len:414 (-) Transcript_23762:278-1519(-)|eukprot:CAMPEP_0117787754 /NCGR_PEP_ID=MMETSP0948-20121206/6581_1 /TAXON_ID=44440 /ORGANISM="Chattonella subsalsa, Strain CCMP2191" /LENGTH=413 /DNA_ID=CAMNT_0005616939 /DNA_START=9 /DNA_END=1250 /DNA_ORIENTATION=+
MAVFCNFLPVFLLCCCYVIQGYSFPHSPGALQIKGFSRKCFRHSSFRPWLQMSTSSHRTEETSGASSLARADLSVDRVLGSMGEDEKYNAVVQGLAAIISEGKEGRKFEELFELLTEMQNKRIKPNSRSLSLSIDAAAASGDVEALGTLLPLLKQAGAGQVYGRSLPRVTPLPSDEDRRSLMLEDLEPVPTDDRQAETSASLVFLALLLLDLGWQGIGSLTQNESLIPTLLFWALVGTLVYDIINGAGKISGSVAAGLNRLFLKDFEREAQCEAASFLVAYGLGLPCFCFKPNVLEALKMVQNNQGDLQSLGGVQRLLVWLMAPVAAESATHKQMIVSDPRQATAFLKLVRDKGLVDLDDGISDSERIKWAMSEAKNILKAEGVLYESLQRTLEAGAATVGECVTVTEQNFLS